MCISCLREEYRRYLWECIEIDDSEPLPFEKWLIEREEARK